jgi:glycosyltransferase involved in cell wall biosynthesis
MPSGQRQVIWQVIPNLALGGATRIVLWLSRHLDPKRYDVRLITGMTSARDRLESDAEGLNVHVLPFLCRDINPLSDQTCRRELARMMRAERPALVHAHGSKAMVLAGLAARDAKLPAVHTIHGWPFPWPAGGAAALFEISALKHALDSAAALVAVSQATMYQGLHSGIGSLRQYRVIYPAAEVEMCRHAPRFRQAVRRELEIAPEAPVVGSVMRLCRQKAPLDLVKVAPLVVAQHPRVRFVVVGDGELSGKMKKAIETAGLSEHFIMTGSRGDVTRLLGAFDVFVLTSRWEGFPLVCAEAGAAGLPVVSTRVGGVAELVGDGKTGLLVPPEKPQAMAAAINLLLDQPQKARTMGRAACEAVKTAGLGIDEMVRHYEDLYEQILT